MTERRRRARERVHKRGPADEERLQGSDDAAGDQHPLERAGLQRRLLEHMAPAQVETAIPTLQEKAGNAAVQKVLGGSVAGVQRHAEGELTIEPGVLQEGPPPPIPVEAAPTEPAQVEGEPAATTTPDADQPEADKKKGGAGDKKIPAPAKPAYLDLAAAEDVLSKAYGDVHKITPGKIEFFENDAAILDKYDEVCIAGGIKYSDAKTPERPWKKGDAKRKNPLGLRGFAWGDASYINKSAAVSTTTPHEMLHLNTSKEFDAGTSSALDEGCTQWLANKALEKAKIPLPKNPSYVEETEVADTLVALVGEELVKKAYFKGEMLALTKEVDDILGAGTFEKFDKACAEGKLTRAQDILLGVEEAPAEAPKEKAKEPAKAGAGAK